MGPIVVGNLIGTVHAVRVFGSAGDGVVAWFLDRADARAFGEDRYPGEYILDSADIASVSADIADEARVVARKG